MLVAVRAPAVMNHPEMHDSDPSAGKIAADEALDTIRNGPRCGGSIAAQVELRPPLVVVRPVAAISLGAVTPSRRDVVVPGQIVGGAVEHGDVHYRPDPEPFRSHEVLEPGSVCIQWFG